MSKTREQIGYTASSESERVRFNKVKLIVTVEI